jgi:hypothetical protein
MAVEEIGLRISLKERRETAQGLTEVTDGLDDAGDAAERSGRQAESSGRRWGRLTGALGAAGRGALSVTGAIGRGVVGAAKAGAVGVGILSVAVAGLSAKAIQLTSDARETGSAFDTVFGKDARAVQKNLDALTRRFGLYNPELQDAARQFGVFGKAAGVARKELPGFSTDLLQAGLDLSSFYNTDPGETFQALQSGLSGEAEPLRKFGIFISDATMKAKAASMGLTDELTEQQKVMVRQALIMDSLGDAQGDLARTSQGFANQQRAAGGRLKTFLTMLGGPLTTAATGAFRGFNSIAKVGIRQLRKELPDLEVKAESLSRKFARWGRQLAKELPDAIKTASGYWDRLSARVKEFTAQGGRDELGQLGDNIKELGPAAAAFGRELPGISDTLSVVNTVTGFLADHTDLLAKAVPYLIAGYIALKVSQLAANVVLAASIPLKIAELASNRALTKSNKQLVASRAAVVATTTGEAAAVTANTAAQNTGILARGRAVVGMVAQRAAMVAGAAVTGVMTAAQWALNVAMTANPIGLIIVGIALLIGAFVLAYKKIDWFRAGVQWAMDKVVGAAKFAWDWIKGHWPLLLAILTGPFGIAVYAIAKNWDRIKAGATAVKDWVVEKFQALISFYTRMPGRIAGVAKGMFDGIKNAFRSAINWIIGAWNGLEFKIPGFDPPGPGPKFGGFTLGVPDIQMLARGGRVMAGRPYIVGDGGVPELFVPDAAGRVLPRIPPPAHLPVPSEADLHASMADDDFDPRPIRSSSGPTIVKLMINQRELGEAVLDDFEDRSARR